MNVSIAGKTDCNAVRNIAMNSSIAARNNRRAINGSIAAIKGSIASTIVSTAAENGGAPCDGSEEARDHVLVAAYASSVLGIP